MFGRIRAKHYPDSAWSWLACICASVYQACSLGFSLSFGVMLPELMREFDKGRQQIVWLGSLSIAFTFFLCPLGSILCKKIGCRFTAIAGGLTCTVGLMMTSFSCSLPLMFITHSFLFGLGSSLIFTASFLITAKNVHKRRSFAVGVVSVGGSIGVLIMGPFLQLLLDMVGWRGTYRIISAMLCLVCATGATFGDPSENDHKKAENDYCLMEFGKVESCSTEAGDLVKSTNSDDDSKKKKIAGNYLERCKCDVNDNADDAEDPNIKDAAESEKKMGQLLDFSVFKVPSFSVLVISLTLMCLGHYTPQLHLVKHCLELRISADSASRLFIFLGLASSVCRVLTGRLCDIALVNTVYLYQFGVLLVGFMTIALPSIKGYTGILIYIVLYGIGDGIVITTMNSILMFTVDEKRRSAALGLGFSLVSLGIAGGPPLAGFLADTFAGYKWSFTVAGILMQFAGILPVVLLRLKKKEALQSADEQQRINARKVRPSGGRKGLK